MRPLFVLVFLSALALGQDLEILRLSPPARVRPGDFAVQVWQITNTSSAPIAAQVRWEIPQGWEALGLPETLYLGPGQMDYLFLTLYVSRTAPSGMHIVRILLHWDGQEIAMEATVDVEGVAALELLAPSAQAAPAGESLSFILRVVNRGNALERVSLVVRPPPGWGFRLSPAEFSLAPGEGGEARLTLTIPAEAPVGREVVMALARSSAFPDLEVRAAWYVEVLPPGPEQVPVQKFARLSLHGFGRLSHDFLAQEESSFLGFAGRGTVLEGGLELSARWAGPWASQPLQFLHFRALYVTNALEVEAGRVGLPFNTLLSSLAFWGLGIRISLDPLRFSFGSGWDQSRGRTGGTFSLRPNWGEVGGAYREEHGDGFHSQAGLVRVALRALEDLTFHLETGVAQVQGLTRYAGQIGLAWEVPELFFLEARTYALDPGFPALVQDRAGALFSGRLGTEGAQFRFVCEWQRDNLRGLSPLIRTWQGIQAGWDLFPVEWPLRGGFLLSLRRTADLAFPPTLDERTARAEARAVFAHQGFTLEVQGACTRFEDTSRQVWTRQEFRERLTLQISATLSLSGDFRQTILYFPEGPQIKTESVFSLVTERLRLAWEYGRDGGQVRLEFSVSPASPLSLKFGGEVRWDVAGIPTRFSVTLDFDYAFTWAPRFLPVYGLLSGEVFADLNGDGRRDPGEPGVPGVVLALDDVRVSSGKDGVFRFPGRPPGEYVLRLVKIPAGYSSLQPALPVTLRLGVEEQISIPLVPYAGISGLVFLDLNGDGKWAPDEPGLSRVYVRIVSEKDQEIMVISDAAGRFNWSELLPGRYRVELLLESLPTRHEPTSPTSLKLSLVSGEKKEVAFGVREKPRPVIIIQPPLAEFAWTPTVPKAGEPVLFDGSPSQAFDSTEIVAYAWDFDSDGRNDAEGVRVTWIFLEAGFYLVTLTVTDSTGLTGQTQYLLQVQSQD